MAVSLRDWIPFVFQAGGFFHGCLNLERAKVRCKWADGDRAVGGLFRHVDNSDPVKNICLG